MNRYTRAYVTGLVFIVLVAVIWAASSVLIQYIYSSGDNNFHSPFMVTYIGVSLFTLWIPTQRLMTCCRRHCCCCSQKAKSSSTASHITTVRQQGQQQSLADGGDYLRVPYQTVPLHHSNSHEEDEEVQQQSQHHDDGLQQQHHVPPRHVFVHAGENDNDVQVDLLQCWTEADHLRAAVYIAPVWFLANWTYNASLAYTSITSSTVLASTGSLFTFMFAVVTADEHFRGMKLAGVLLGVAGSVLTALHDSSTTTTTAHSDDGTDDNGSSSGTTTTNVITWMLQRRFSKMGECPDGDDCPAAAAVSPLLGDVLGLISAVGYGTYAVQTRVLCPKDESLYSMQTLLGYIGLLNMVVLSPIAIYQVLSGRTELAWIVVGFLVVKGLFDNVLSDYLWLRAVMLTNATTATVGLGLTIPLAFASDKILGHGDSVLTAEQVMGALAVLAGFVLVNLGNRDDDDDEQVDPSNGNGSTTRMLEHNHPPFSDSDESQHHLPPFSDSNESQHHHPPFSDSDESQRGQEIVNLQDRSVV